MICITALFYRQKNRFSQTNTIANLIMLLDKVLRKVIADDTEALSHTIHIH